MGSISTPSTLLVAVDGIDDSGEVDRLKEFVRDIADGNGWWHHMAAVWLVRTKRTPTEVRDLLRSQLSTETRVLVVDVTGSVRAWSGQPEHGSAWLANRW
jgi:hypothetical protein